MATIYQFNKPAIHVPAYKIANITPHDNNLIRVCFKGEEDNGILAYLITFSN